MESMKDFFKIITNIVLMVVYVLVGNYLEAESPSLC